MFDMLQRNKNKDLNSLFATDERPTFSSMFIVGFPCCSSWVHIPLNVTQDARKVLFLGGLGNVVKRVCDGIVMRNDALGLIRTERCFHALVCVWHDCEAG